METERAEELPTWLEVLDINSIVIGFMLAFLVGKIVSYARRFLKFDRRIQVEIIGRRRTKNSLQFYVIYNDNSREWVDWREAKSKLVHKFYQAPRAIRSNSRRGML